MQKAIRAGALLAMLATAVAFARVSARQGQDSTQLHRLSIGMSPTGTVASTDSGRTWRLAAFNKTSQIDAAYVYGDSVVVFGWIGCCVGVTTIIDAVTGAERLEFLNYDPHITPKGLIVFRRFYPHFSAPSIISDAIAEIDLKRPIPLNIPSRPNENPTDQVGIAIYPEAPTLGVRHDIGHNFAITDAGTLLFLADRLSSGGLCLARLSLRDSVHRLSKGNCLTSDSFGITDLSDLHIRQFSENAFGDLILSADLGKPASAVQRDFEIDKSSLAIAALKINQEKSDKGTLAIPWSIQRNALTGFVPRYIAGREQETVKARLTIDRAGNVSDVVVSGSSTDVLDLIRGAVLKWKFKPTVLDGRPVQVVTEFTSTAGGLAKVPD